jgi:hypothetical protein
MLMSFSCAQRSGTTGNRQFLRGMWHYPCQGPVRRLSLRATSGAARVVIYFARPSARSTCALAAWATKARGAAEAARGADDGIASPCILRRKLLEWPSTVRFAFHVMRNHRAPELFSSAVRPADDPSVAAGKNGMPPSRRIV